MLNSTPHRRFHIPDKLAMLAALLLLVISIANFNSESEVYTSGADTSPAVKVESTDNDSINDATEHKRRGLNLGFLLFRRG